ncbi:hypothetical protein [[Eubacterium] cellulosolvens]
MLRQLQLKSKIVSALDGTAKARYIFPFFDNNLKIAFFMIELDSNRLILTSDFPQSIRGRMIEFSGNLGLVRYDLKLPKNDLMEINHFDPWWTLKNRKDVPKNIKTKIMKTNIVNRKIKRKMVRDVVFTDDLMAVEGFMIGDGVFKSEFYSKQELLSVNCEWLK